MVWRARYNADGDFIESTDFNPDGSVFRRDVYSYDASGGRKTKASYDTAGLLVEKQTFDLNNGGRLISVESYKKDRSVDSKATWQYNAQGQRVGVEAHDSKGNLTRSVSFNPAGQMTESDDYKDGVLVGKQVLNYDVNANLLEVLRYGDGRSPIDDLTDPIRLVNSYDSAGHLVERKEFNPDGSLMWKQTSAFDKNRNEVEHRVYDQAGLLKSHMTYAYEYDAAGNWTVQKMGEEGSNKACSHPLRVLYRTIRYY
jgi:antitoxin component YwqK of YwqJK toxin-antitoxin module